MPAVAAPSTHYQYALELYRDNSDGDSEQVATARVKPDWDPAYECARWECALHSIDQTAATPKLRLGAEKVSIEPVWSGKLSEPYLESFRAVARGENGHEAACEIPTAYMQPLAQKASTKVIEEGKLEEGQSFRYLVTAYPREDEKPAKKPGFVVEPVAQEINLRKRSIAEYLRRSRPYGPVDDAEMHVFIPQSVLDEGQDALQKTGAAETGGILIGFLNWDVERGCLFMEVTAQIRAKHTQEALTSLTFTPATWSDVEAAVRLRGQNELQCGWWHSHPAREWCKDCPIESRRVCKRSGEFFSNEDTALHRTVFPRAYSIALVVSDSYNDGLTWPLFSWKQGTIQRRGFHVLKD